MITIQLTRKSRQGKAVRGILRVQYELFGNGQAYEFPTLENADYLIPEGTYPLKMTWSPKFKKEMPEICDVPEREGIRIHLGATPEHSTGCVLLLNAGDLYNLKIFIGCVEKWEDSKESLKLKVNDKNK